MAASRSLKYLHSRCNGQKLATDRILGQRAPMLSIIRPALESPMAGSDFVVIFVVVLLAIGAPLESAEVAIGRELWPRLDLHLTRIRSERDLRDTSLLLATQELVLYEQSRTRRTSLHLKS